jgi:hypothetical protein
MRLSSGLAAFAAFIALIFPASAHAQTPSENTPWSVEGEIGWAFPVSGNILSAGIGRINDQATVINAQTYGDVYGTGVAYQFGAGYMLDERNEVLGSFAFQSVGADLQQIGTIANVPLYATFDRYRTIEFEAGYRRYFADRAERLRPFGGVNLGVAVIREIDADLAAPALNQTLNVTNFYDRTGAFTFGFSGGVLYALSDRIDVKGELGFHHTSGLSQIEGLAGTGLENVNDNSGRWTMPLTLGARVRF